MIFLKSESAVENKLFLPVNKYLGNFTATQIKQCFAQNKVKQRSATYFLPGNNFWPNFFTSLVLLGTAFSLKLLFSLSATLIKTTRPHF